MQWLWKPLIQRALERDHYSVSGCWVIKELCPMFWLTSIGLACSNKGEHLLWALLSAALWAKGKLLSIGVSARGTFKPEGITTQICTPELARRWWDWNREDQHPVLFSAWRDQQGRSWQQGQTFPYLDPASHCEVSHESFISVYLWLYNRIPSSLDQFSHPPLGSRFTDLACRKWWSFFVLVWFWGWWWGEC